MTPGKTEETKIRELAGELKLKTEEVFSEIFSQEAKVSIEVSIEPLEETKLDLDGQEIIFWADFFQEGKGFSFLSLDKEESFALAEMFAKEAPGEGGFGLSAMGEIFNLISSSCLAVLAYQYGVKLRLGSPKSATAQEIEDLFSTAKKELENGKCLAADIIVAGAGKKAELNLFIIFKKINQL